MWMKKVESTTILEGEALLRCKSYGRACLCYSSYSSNRRPQQTNTPSMFEFSQAFKNPLIIFTFFWNFVPNIPNIHWLFGRPGLTKWKSWTAKDWILHRTQLNSAFAKSRFAARGPPSARGGLPARCPSPVFQQVFWPPLNQRASICIRYGLKNGRRWVWIC